MFCVRKLGVRVRISSILFYFPCPGLFMFCKLNGVLCALPSSSPPTGNNPGCIFLKVLIFLCWCFAKGNERKVIKVGETQQFAFLWYMGKTWLDWQSGYKYLKGWQPEWGGREIVWSSSRCGTTSEYPKTWFFDQLCYFSGLSIFLTSM